MNNKSFEQQLTELIPLKYFESFGYGRNAILTLLRALELMPDDEVILPAFAPPSITPAIKKAGLKPIYVDCVPNTLNLCPKKILENFTDKTKVIFVVHTYGTAAPIDKICDIAIKNNIWVIEDIAHSLFSEFEGHYLGTFGHFALLSFTKQMINFQGAAIGTNNKKIYQHMQILKKRNTREINNIKHFYYFIMRLILSYLDSNGGILQFMFLRFFNHLNVVFRHGVLDHTPNESFIEMSPLSKKLTLKQIYRFKKENRDNIYGKFKQKMNKKLRLPDISPQQTGRYPSYLGGCLNKNYPLLKLLSIRTWHNPHEKGIFPVADELYENYNNYAKTVGR